MLDATHRVRDLAYRIWETEGCPAGREREHWLEAERRLMDESGKADVAVKPRAKKAASKGGMPAARSGRSKKQA